MAPGNGSQIWRVTLGMVTLALAFAPAIQVTLLGIWIPTAMVQEMFGVSYASLRLMQLGFFLVPVGHAFTLLISYPSRLVADTLVSDGNDYIRYQAFGLAVYCIYGLVITSLIGLALRLRVPVVDCALLLLVAFSKMLTMRMTEIGLTIDYDRLVTILYTVVALLWMLRVRAPDRYRPTLRNSGSLGVLMGVAIGTKLTLGAILLPFVIPMLISRSMRRSNLYAVRNVLVFGLVTVATFACVIFAYVLFRWDYFARFGVEAFAGLTDEALVHQSSPFLWDELRRWLDPTSYYFGFQCLASLCVLLLALLARRGWQRRDRFVAEFLVACALSAVVLGYELVRRTAGNSMLDWSAWVAFVTGVSGALLVHRLHGKTTARWLVATLSMACAASLVLADPIQILHRFEVNSELARAIQNRIDAAGDLPHVYYMSDSSQPLLFPSVDLSVVATSASSAEGHDPFVRRYHPRAEWALPANGLVRGSHLMIVPEYLDTLPDTPANRREWPDMYNRVAVLETSPQLAGVVGDLKNACTLYRFAEQDRSHLHNFYGYATRVTVCLLTQT